jgi:hypothetical protein
VPTSSETSIWLTLIPVLVGGAIGVAGSFFGPWLVESRKQKYERQKKRSEKLEELVATVYEFDRLISKLLQGRKIREVGLVAMAPIAKIEAIAVTYFPDFEGRVLELESAANRLEAAISVAGQKRTDKAYDAYCDARNALLRELKEFAAKHHK